MATNNHYEALRKKRFLERQREARERLQEQEDNALANGSQNPPVYQRQEDWRPVTPEPVYGWKHPSKIRHRNLDNTPEDKVFPVIQPMIYAPEPPKSHPVLPRVPHFKVNGSVVIDPTWYYIQQQLKLDRRLLKNDCSMHGSPNSLNDLDAWYQSHGIPVVQRKGRQPVPDHYFMN